MNIESFSRSRREVVMLSLIIILWAASPVFAKWFLLQGMEPVTFITIRLLSFSLLNAVFFLGWRFLSGSQYSPIPHLLRRTFFPALGLLGMTVFNYIALIWISPSLHLTILRFNTLLLIACALVQPMRKRIRSSLILALLAVPLLLLTIFQGTPPWLGLLFSALSLLSYTFYSLVTEHEMRQNRISARYPLFAFTVGIILGIFGLLLLPFQNISALFTALTLPAIVYIAICVWLPHLFHHLVLQKMSFKHFTDLSLLEVPLAALLEMGFLGIFLTPIQYAAVAFILLSLFLYRWKVLTSHVH